MSQSLASETVSAAAPGRPLGKPDRPFFGLIDPVLVPGAGKFDFEGAVSEKQAAAAWAWMGRDLAPDLIEPIDPEDEAAARAALQPLIPELSRRARQALAATADDADAERKMRVQLGGREAMQRFPLLLNVLKCEGLLERAQVFGHATNSMTDDAALSLALQSLPLSDPPVAAVLMQAAIGQATNPPRLMAVAVRIAGSGTEGSIRKAGFGPLVEAILSHAQAQIPALSQFGAFADIDLTCCAIERFHRLMRAVTGYVELDRRSRWSMIAAGLTKATSELIAPRLHNVAPDVNRALRRRDAVDRYDDDLLLSALNGCYVLATVRDCRDSLALNALFDQTWAQVGQALEMHAKRNLEAYRQDPGNEIVRNKLDAAIKMAELRFTEEYADILRKLRDGAQRAG